MTVDVFVVSDFTGETAEHVARAAYSQFGADAARLSRFRYISTEEKAEDVLQVAQEKNALIICTMVDHKLRKYFVERAAERKVEVVDILGPILKALRLPRVCGITHAGEIGIDAQLARLEAALAGGLRLVQIREPALPDADCERFARAVVERCHAAGALAVVNGDAALARRIGADGLHLPARSLMAADGRPDFEWVGASCHSRAELEQAAALELDYALLGAVRPTQSHPERATLGWPAFGDLVARLPLPVFALGGLSAGDLETAKAAGAHGVAGIRGIWQA